MNPLGLMRGIGGQCEQPIAGAMMDITPTTRGLLLDSLQRTETKLADIRRAIDILDRNPDLEELLTLLSRTLY